MWRNESMDLGQVVIDTADILKYIDDSGSRFKEFHPGIGPYGEPQLVKLVAAEMSRLPQYSSGVTTMRTPDLFIRKHWALEVKLARPFGDNDRCAENWSVNLLHPYSGNTSLLGDCLKLQAFNCEERKGVLAIGYEHEPAQIPLEPLWSAFELIAAGVMNLNLGPRVVARRCGLIHPVHQQLVVIGWELR
jgi:hypothetical protein